MSAPRPPRKPTPEEIEAAEGREIPDVLAPGLKIVFCGINPGLYTAAVGYHFARPGNRFWPALYAAGYTPRLLGAHEQRELLDYGYGITNLVPRATRGAAELSRAELRRGGERLIARIEALRPVYLAVLGIGAYRQAFGRPKAAVGPQEETIGATRIWALPNPSGLNAHYQLADLAALFRELRLAAA